MRAIAATFVACAVALGPSAEASAQRRAPQVGGTYAASFEEVANNCGSKGKTLSAAPIRVTQEDRELSIRIPRVPIMTGKLGRRGKLRADADGVRGAGGRFAVSGRIERGQLHLVLIAEHYEGGQPSCTQSWSVTGKKQ